MSETPSQPHTEQKASPEQKLVRLNGQSSMLMTGDDTFPRSRDDVVPRLLNGGWRISSVVVGSDGTGYAVFLR
jgi:hypothetical protein